MTTNVISELGNKYLPFSVETLFTPQRAADMWFGDELPPTWQDEMRGPAMLQAKFMLSQHVLRALVQGEQRATVERQQRRYRAAKAKVGGRHRN